MTDAAARREATRQRLYEAAVTLIAEQGFSATTVDEIAERAGVAKGTVYYNFASKTVLFEELLRHGVGLLTASFRAAVRGPAAGARRSRRWSGPGSSSSTATGPSPSCTVRDVAHQPGLAPTLIGARAGGRGDRRDVRPGVTAASSRARSTCGWPRRRCSGCAWWSPGLAGLPAGAVPGRRAGRPDHGDPRAGRGLTTSRFGLASTQCGSPDGGARGVAVLPGPSILLLGAGGAVELDRAGAGVDGPLAVKPMRHRRARRQRRRSRSGAAAVTVVPDWVTVAFQPLPRVTPDGQVQVTRPRVDRARCRCSSPSARPGSRPARRCPAGRSPCSRPAGAPTATCSAPRRPRRRRPVGPVPPDGGIRYGCRIACFGWLTVVQSSLDDAAGVAGVRVPRPVGERHPVDAGAHVRHQLLSATACPAGSARVLPNSPTMIGAMFCLYR